MARKRTKYTLRKDGRIVLSDTINGERKYFYGKTDKEVEQKRDDYIRECEKHANEAADNGRTFEAVADDWWEQCEPRLSPNTVCGYRTAKNRAVDAFGDQYVTDITGHQIVVFLQRFAARGYSQKVINNTKSSTTPFFAAILMQTPASGFRPQRETRAYPESRRRRTTCRKSKNPRQRVCSHECRISWHTRERAAEKPLH